MEFISKSLTRSGSPLKTELQKNMENVEKYDKVF